MAKVRANPKWSVPGTSSDIAAGWKVYTYKPGTSANKDTYTTFTEGVANTNPVILDSRGEADIWFSGTYKIVVTDDDDITVWTVDNYGEGEAQIQTGNYNQAVNGSFESTSVLAGEPDNWVVVDDTGGSHVIDTTTQQHGLNSLKFTSTGSGGGTATSDFFEVEASKVVAVNFTLQSSVADVRNVVDLLWYTGAQVLISTSNIYDDSTTNPTAWAAKEGTATPPSTARYAKIKLYGCHSSDPTSGSTAFDNILITDNYAFRHTAQTFLKTQTWTKGSDVASAAALVFGDGNYFDITGTTTVTSITTVATGTAAKVHFDGILTLTHHATNLVLPGAANIVTAAGDEAEFVEYGTGIWRCTNYSTANGLLIVPESTLADVHITSTSNITVPDGTTTAVIMLCGGGGGGGGGGDGATANGTAGTIGTASTLTLGTTVLRSGGGAPGNPGVTGGGGAASSANAGAASTIAGTVMGTSRGIYETGFGGDGNGSTPNPASGGDGGGGAYSFGGASSTSASGVVGVKGGGGAGGFGQDGAGGGGGGSGSVVIATLTVAKDDSLVFGIGAGGAGGAGTAGEGTGGTGGTGYAVISWGQ